MSLPNDKKEGMISERNKPEKNEETNTNNNDDFNIIDKDFIEVLNDYDDWAPTESMLGKISGKIKNNIKKASQKLKKTVSDYVKNNIIGLKKDLPDEKILPELLNYLRAFCIDLTQEGVSLNRFIGTFKNYLEVLTKLENEEMYNTNDQKTLKKIYYLIDGYDSLIYDSAMKFYQKNSVKAFDLLLKKHKFLRENGTIFKKSKNASRF